MLFRYSSVGMTKLPMPKLINLMSVSTCCTAPISQRVISATKWCQRLPHRAAVSVPEPAQSITFSGFRSRCTMPCAWSQSSVDINRNITFAAWASCHVPNQFKHMHTSHKHVQCKHQSDLVFAQLNNSVEQHSANPAVIPTYCVSVTRSTGSHCLDRQYNGRTVHSAGRA
jgi:hypothetical protein